MSNDQIIRQDSPGNILWKIFRILVEDTEIPEGVHNRIKEKIEENRYEH